MNIEIQYDASQHAFKLVDQELKTLLEGDALYDQAYPYMFEEAVIRDSSQSERYSHENSSIHKS
jgi:hypothetical protein